MLLLVAYAVKDDSGISPISRDEFRRLGVPLGAFDPRAVIRMQLRVVLDLCSGARAPITHAFLQLCLACLDPVDNCARQGGRFHNIWDDSVYDVLL